jgi:hypothetical protein
VATKPLWRQREDALVVGAPLVVMPALAIVPIVISFLIDPVFPHARLAGVVVVPLTFLAESFGLSRLGLTLQSEFDVLTLFGAATALLFWVIAGCSGILLAIVISHF